MRIRKCNNTHSFQAFQANYRNRGKFLSRSSTISSLSLYFTFKSLQKLKCHNETKNVLIAFIHTETFESRGNTPDILPPLIENCKKLKIHFRLMCMRYLLKLSCILFCALNRNEQKRTDEGHEMKENKFIDHASHLCWAI